MVYSINTSSTQSYLWTSNNVQFIVSQIGPIGGYIDLTFNGTYTDATGNHTVSGTAHVVRDN